MKTKVIVNEEELIQFDNREFKLGEEVKCYGLPFIVTSVTRRKRTYNSEEEMLVYATEKELYYKALNLYMDNLTKYNIYTTNDKPYKLLRTPYKNPFDEVK